MQESLETRCRELEAKISVLEDENERLAERAEEILLLGLVGESVSHLGETRDVIENVLERISVLKDIPYCACCAVSGESAQVVNAYAAFRDDNSAADHIHLSSSLLPELEQGACVVQGVETEDQGISISLHGTDFTPHTIVIVPFVTRSFPHGVFVFADDERTEDRLSPMLPLLQRAVDMTVAKLDNISLVDELKQLNAELDCRVAHRTHALEQSNAALRESEARYRSLFHDLPIGLYRSKLGTQFVDVNPALVDMLGYPDCESLLATATTALFATPEDRQRLVLAERGDGARGLELQLRRQDGTTIWVTCHSHVARDDQDQALYYEGALQPITERKRAEEALRKLSRAVEQSPASVIITDTEGNIEYVNPKFTQLTGYTVDEVLDRNPSILKSGHTPPEEYKKLWETIASGREWRGEFLNKKKNGEFYWEMASISPVRNAEGTITHFVAVKEDITERKRAEERLRESEARWRSLTENSPDHILTLDRELNMEFANYASPGLTVEELIGTPLYTYVAEDRQAEIKALHEQVLKTGELASYETEYDTPDGSVIYYESRIVPRLLHGEVIGLTVSARDITARKQVEKERLVHLRFLESMDRVNRAIQGTNDLEQMTSDVLDVVLSIFDCDRAFLQYPCDPETDSWRVPMERTKPEYPGGLTLGLEMPVDADVAATFRILRESDRPVKFGPGSKYPLPTEVAARFSIRSFMSMALYPKTGKPWQFGIHQCSFPRIWNSEEERLLQEIGHRLADALTSLLAHRHLQERERALQQSNNLLRATIETAPTAIIGLDLDGKVQMVWNPAAEKMLGWNAEEVMGRLLPSVPVDSQEEFGGFRERIRRGESLDDVEVSRQRRDGSPIDYSIYASPLHDAEDRLIGNIAVLVDITERKRVQRIMQARLRLLEFASSHSMDELLTATLDEIEALTSSTVGFYHFLESDQETLFLQNWSTNTLKNMCTAEGKGSHYDIAQAGVWVDCVHERRPVIHNDYASLPHRKGLPEGHAPVIREVVVPIFRGNLIKAIIGVGNKPIPYNESDIEIVSQLGDLSWDIAERKRAEEALKEQYSTLRGIINSTNALIFSVDRQYRYTSFNQGHGAVMEALYGAEIEIGHSLLEHMTVAEDRETAKHNLDRALGGEQLVEEAYSGEEPRSRRYFQVSHSPIKTETGEIIGVAVLAQDMTERKRAEEALRESEKQFRLLAENSTDMISLHTPDGVYLYASPACKTLLGYEPDELVGLSAYELFHPADAAAVRQSHTIIIDQPVVYTVQYRIRRKDGDYIWFETTSRTIRDSQTGAVIEIQAASRDITKRKQTEEALQRYTERLTILHEIDQCIVIARSPDAIANTVLERLVQLIPCEWASVILYDDKNAEGQIIALQQTMDSYVQIEKKISFISNQVLEQLKTGQSIVTADLKSVEGPRAQLALHVMAHGLRSGVAVPLTAQNRLIGILALASLQVDFFTPEHQSIAEEIGTQVAIVLHQAALNDQIARHNVELEQRVRERTIQLEVANEELRILSRVKDEFVSNVSHELRTPITNLKLRHHLLAARPDRWEGHLAVMSRETKRLEQIIESLLYLSRLDQDRVDWNPIPVDLNHLVSQFVRDRTALAQSGELSLSFTGEPNLPLVEADVALWEQALSILLTNAFNYTPAGGHVEIRTQVREREAQRWVGVSVSDTGPGISPDEQSHLFERFFRGTAGRESGTPGTGLGLSIVHEIVNKHCGRVEVFSEGVPDKGATFSLWLLAVGSADEKRSAPEE